MQPEILAELESKSYKELQTIAEQLGISLKVGQSKVKLRELIIAAVSEKEENPEATESEDAKESEEEEKDEASEEKDTKSAAEIINETEENEDKPAAPTKVDADAAPKHSYVMNRNVRYDGQKYKKGDILDNNNPAVRFFRTSGYCE